MRGTDEPRHMGGNFIRITPACAGNSPITALVLCQGRITPACAGNSLRRKPRRRLKGDHPRVCGEQPCTYVLGCAGKGSPPRVRGTDNSTMEENLYRRITPACAGNRALFGRVGKEDEDHPRVCGEQHRRFDQTEARAGSPPRVRGTVGCTFCGRTIQRITPACAGNSTRPDC